MPGPRSRRRLASVTFLLALMFSSSTAAGAGSQVTGWLDSVKAGDRTVSVRGWAADPDSSIAAGVHIYLDGRFATGGPARLRRPDVDRATGLGEFHGFEFDFEASAGTRRVCVYAIDRTGDPNRLLGCRSVLVGPTQSGGGSSSGDSPIGWLDSASLVDGGVQIRGWGLDPNTTDSIGIHVYVNGAYHSGFKADEPRGDVARVYGLGNLHGFNEKLSLYSGWHSICVYGIDKTGDRNALIDCANVAIPFDAGAVVTASGVVMPILETRANSWTVLTACTNVTSIAFGDATKVTDVDVVLDAGHGGSESGAAANGLVEKTLNLDIARRVETRLENAGYRVLITRYRDYRLPIRTRAAIAQAVHAEALVSIHHNGGATLKAGHPGTMAIYQHNLPQARRLGMILFETMYREAKKYPTSWVSNSLTGASTALSGSGRDLFGIHRFTPEIPSVITEWGYITNPAEAGQLKTSTVKNAEADAIAAGIIRWFETTATGSGDIGSWVRTTSPGTGGTSGCVDPSIP